MKRFKIETHTLNSKFLFIKEGKDNRLIKATTADEPILQMQTGRGAQLRKAKIKLHKVVDVMGWRAVGNKLTDFSKSDLMEWAETGKPSSQTELFD